MVLRETKENDFKKKKNVLRFLNYEYLTTIWICINGLKSKVIRELFSSGEASSIILGCRCLLWTWKWNGKL